MGAWDELDTEISVDVDTADLEAILDLDDEYGIFEPIQKSVSKLITNIHDGSKEAVEDISDRNRSFQEQYIIKNCKHPTGMLASSIEKQEIDGGYGFIVGTIISHIYPMSVEYGADIYPRTKKVLRFLAPEDWDGETDEDGFVFLPEAHPQPHPYVQPAYEDTEQIAGEILLHKVEIAKQRI